MSMGRYSNEPGVLRARSVLGAAGLAELRPVPQANELYGLVIGANGRAQRWLEWGSADGFLSPGMNLFPSTLGLYALGICSSVSLNMPILLDCTAGVFMLLNSAWLIPMVIFRKRFKAIKTLNAAAFREWLFVRYGIELPVDNLSILPSLALGEPRLFKDVQGREFETKLNKGMLYVQEVKKAWSR